MLHLRYNQLVFIRTLVGTLRHADWAGAWDRRGLAGVLSETVAAFSGYSAWPFFVDAHSPWTPELLADLLQRHGIAAWGWGYHGGEYYFRVKLRQAYWAEYVLLSHDVPLGGELLDASARGRSVGRSRPAAQKAPPTTPGTAPSSETAPARRRFDPLRQIDRLVDRIAGL